MSEGLAALRSNGGGILPGGITITQIITGGRVFEIRITRIAALKQVAAVVHDDIVNDEQAALVRRMDHLLQIRQAAPVRIHLVKIKPRITVKLPPGIQHNGRNPDGRRPERLDVIQFLFDALEIAAVNRSARVPGRIEIAIRVIVRWIAVIKAVRDDLVNALRLPEAVGNR